MSQKIGPPNGAAISQARISAAVEHIPGRAADEHRSQPWRDAHASDRQSSHASVHLHRRPRARKLRGMPAAQTVPTTRMEETTIATPRHRPTPSEASAQAHLANDSRSKGIVSSAHTKTASALPTVQTQSPDACRDDTANDARRRPGHRAHINPTAALLIPRHNLAPTATARSVTPVPAVHYISHHPAASLPQPHQQPRC
ncbi:hypothetical protein C8J57DRAFT_1255166 [Mycena rebaudengoi]|nr:hypothetical protein C8J57DRAFT_1255166 [Mycena rebaudengoi]